MKGFLVGFFVAAILFRGSGGAGIFGWKWLAARGVQAGEWALTAVEELVMEQGCWRSFENGRTIICVNKSEAEMKAEAEKIIEERENDL